MNLQDIHDRIHHRPMRGVQVLVVIACVLINMVDGFDILAASFVSPIVSREWNLGPETLGILFGAGPLGMATGAFFLSPVADIFGRRTCLMMCLTLMTVGMLLSSTATSVEMLTGLRFVTGLGVGTMASCTGTMVFEFSSLKARNLGLGLVVVGYPIGAVLGGLVSVGLIDAFGWRAIFVFGGCASALLLPVVHFSMPESLDFLIARQPRNTLWKINAVLERLGLEPVREVPAPPLAARSKSGSVLDLLRPPLLSRSLAMSLTYFLYMMSSYFILNWANQLTTDAGFSDASGLSISILLNLGGIVGGTAVGVLSMRLPFRTIANGVLLLMGLAIMAFGLSANSYLLVAASALFIGFGIFGAAVVLYATAAATFPAQVRATGIGLSMSAGRIGSVIGPYGAGLLLAADVGRVGVCIALALPVMLAAMALGRVPVTPAHDVGAQGQSRV